MNISIIKRISNDDNFVEAAMLRLYQRHTESRDKTNPDNIGKGFNHLTQKDGVIQGRWLAQHGKFSDGKSRYHRTRAEHLSRAREILMTHLSQVEEMISEARENKAAELAIDMERRRAEERTKLREQLKLNHERSQIILAELEKLGNIS